MHCRAQLQRGAFFPKTLLIEACVCAKESSPSPCVPCSVTKQGGMWTFFFIFLSKPLSMKSPGHCLSLHCSGYCRDDAGELLWAALLGGNPDRVHWGIVRSRGGGDVQQGGWGWHRGRWERETAVCALSYRVMELFGRGLETWKTWTSSSAWSGIVVRFRSILTFPRLHLHQKSWRLLVGQQH